jgi:transcriptional regulator with XRE-family HTH domain
MSNNLAARSLKEMRERAGLSRKEVAATLGMSVNSVYFWESSRSFPKPELWDDLINLYKFDPSELITLAGGKDSPRVRRYLAQQQAQPERRGRRIYVRSKPEKKQQPKPLPQTPKDQKLDTSYLQQRITDLELQVAELQTKMKFLTQLEELSQAWKRFLNVLEES